MRRPEVGFDAHSHVVEGTLNRLVVENSHEEPLHPNLFNSKRSEQKTLHKAITRGCVSSEDVTILSKHSDAKEEENCRLVGSILGDDGLRASNVSGGEVGRIGATWVIHMLAYLSLSDQI